jgi:hypothetical protein
MLARKGYQPSTAFRIVGEVLDETLAQESGSYGAGEYGGAEAHGPEAGSPEAEDIG